MGFLQEVKKAVLETNAVWGLQTSLSTDKSVCDLFRPVFKAIGKEPELITLFRNEKQKAVDKFDERIKRANKK